jgi:hypothetical protein
MKIELGSNLARTKKVMTFGILPRELFNDFPLKTQEA